LPARGRIANNHHYGAAGAPFKVVPNSGNQPVPKREILHTNGLIVSRGAFPAYCVSHRGDVVDEVVAGALRVAERFDSLADQVERMECRTMLKDEQLAFAEAALALRYPDPLQRGMQPSQLLTCRRTEDLGDNLWVIKSLSGAFVSRRLKPTVSQWSPSPDSGADLDPARRESKRCALGSGNPGSGSLR
jgi:hypothetical protein